MAALPESRAPLPQRAPARSAGASSPTAHDRVLRALVALIDDLTVERDEAGLLRSALEHVVGSLEWRARRCSRRARTAGSRSPPSITSPRTPRLRESSRSRCSSRVAPSCRSCPRRAGWPRPRCARASGRSASWSSTRPPRGSPRSTVRSWRRWASRWAPASRTCASSRSCARRRRARGAAPHHGGGHLGE